MVIDDGGDKIDARSKGVHITRKMEVDIIAGIDGSKSAAGRSAFDAKDRTE